MSDLKSNENVTALEAQHVLQTYKRQPVVFVRGEGTRLFDENGRALSRLHLGHRRRACSATRIRASRR